MSSEDKVRPYHAKASGQEAADAVHAVLQHAADRDQAAHQTTGPKKQPKWMLPLGINLGVFAVYLLIAPPAWVVVSPLEAPPVEEQLEDLRLAMYMQAQRVESYRQQNGRLPTELVEAGSPVPGVEYNVIGIGRYQLVATVGGEALIYDSSDSAAEWVGEGATRKLLRGG